MKGKIVLVTGGARSGKSNFAEKYVTALGTKVAYIATAQVYDQEMADRVSLHRQRRSETWTTYEEPYAAEVAVRNALASVDVVLFDCLTLYTSNLMLAPDAPTTPSERYLFIKQKIDQLLQAATSQSATVVFVTNEVGTGIVPDNALAREYRDLSGLVNQQVAAVADEVYLVICGIAVEIKKIATVVKGDV